jgi:energy-coupling factor transporter ATP-binding protein EcfA2
MQLENFKAFGQRTVIPLAPITLILGQNSSGKSSILQSLNMLKQTRESRDVEALLLPRTENGFADLGSFQEMLFDHDPKRTLSIRLDIVQDVTQRGWGLNRRFLKRPKTLGLEFAFSRKKSEGEITLDGFKLCGDDSAGHIAVFEKCPMPREMRRYAVAPYQSERRRGTEFRAARCTQISSDPTYWQPAYELSVREKASLIDMLTEARQTFHEERDIPRMRGLFDDEEQAGNERARVINALEDYIRFVTSEFTYNDYVQRMIREQLHQIVFLDGFIPTLSGHLDGDQGLDLILLRVLKRPSLLREWSLNIGASSISVGRLVAQTLSALFPLGPFRKPPSRWYIFTGTTPKDVGYQGHLLPDLLFRNNDLLNNTNEWLKTLDIGYEIKLHRLGRDRSSDLFELRLMDTRRKSPVEVGLSDVGFGISQILPFVVQSLAASDQIISVEQPEVHIHPKLQADLGDLLIEAIKEPRRNQFIIETHSEHLVLRLQRRVREKKISPDQISIVYVSRGPNGAIVQPLRLDEEGDFMDDFPGGFFPERLRELR